jgi:hypothetical protein
MTRRRGSKRRGSRRRGANSTPPIIIKTDSVENYNQSVYTQADAMIKLWAKMRALEMQQSGNNRLELSLKDRKLGVQHTKRVFYKSLADDIAALLKHGLMATLDEVAWGSNNSQTLVTIANNINDQVNKIPEDGAFGGNFDISIAFRAATTAQNDENSIKFINTYFQPLIDEARRESAINLTDWYNDEMPNPYNKENYAIWTEIEENLLQQQKLLIAWLNVLHERSLSVVKMIDSKKLSGNTLLPFLASAAVAQAEPPAGPPLTSSEEAVKKYFQNIMADGDAWNTKYDNYSGSSKWWDNVLELNGKKIDSKSFKGVNENIVYNITEKTENSNDRSSGGGRGEPSRTQRYSKSVVIAMYKIEDRINENRKKVVQNSLTAYLDSPLTAWMSQLYAKMSWK